MKHWMVYLALLGVLLILPERQGIDVGLLQPVEVLYLYMKDGAVIVKTDADSYGVGRNLRNAITDLKENADGEIFLDTVSYVLVTEDTKELLPQLGEILRPGTKVALATAPVELNKVARYLKVHEPRLRLLTCMVGQTELPKLMTAGERWYLVQQSNE